MNDLVSLRRKSKKNQRRRLLFESLEHRRVLHAPGTPVLELEVAHGVVASGGFVSQWSDQSAGGNHVVAVGAMQPTFGIAKTPSNLDAISFDGIDDRLIRTLSSGPLTGLPAGNAARSMFIVAQFHDANAWGGVSYGAGATNQTFGIGVASSTANEGREVLTGWGAANDLISTELGYTPPAGPTTGWKLLTAVFDSNVATLYSNGSQIATWNHTYNTNTTNANLLGGLATSRLVLGQEIKELGNIKMDVAAVLLYNSAVTPTFQAQVENYLTEEYLAVDLLPDAVNDATMAQTGTPLQIAKATLLSNDSLGNEPTIIIDFDSATAQGGAVVENEVFFTYTPPSPTFQGLDTFTYTIMDDDGDIDTATVTVNVTSSGLAPDAVDDSVFGLQDTDEPIFPAFLLANDTLGNQPTTITSVSATSAQGGTIAFNSGSGAYIYSPPTGFSGVDTFTYTITDNLSLSDTATVSVTVGVAFSDELVVSGFNRPLSLTNLPDGRMLLLEQGGQIKIVDPSAAVPTTSLYMTVPNVQSTQERGLTDIVLDPDFETNGYFYVYYASSTTMKIRLSRFTHDFNTSTGIPGSEVVLWQDPEAFNLTQFCCHYGGGLDIGPDDKLYLTIGDKWKVPATSQDLTKAGGKILRLNLDGTIPADNPFLNSGPGVLPEIWAYGLRNPFRANWDNTGNPATSRFFIGDVGGNIQGTAREELNIGVAGANYGWHLVEGVQNNPAYEDPIFDYGHTGTTPNGGAIAGGLVYRGNLYPSEFDGAYFFGDYVNGWIHYLKFDSLGNVIDANPNTSELDAFEFSESPIAPVAFEVGADGALYYLDYFMEQLHRITYNVGNQAPVITTASAVPTTGISPLAVTFTGAATDAEDDPLAYTWVFGDGTQAPGPNATHTYLTNGPYTATLQVSDGFQTTVSAPIAIAVGNAPVIQSVSPADGSLFRAGDTLTLSAVVTDVDGPITGSSYDWTVRFVHNAHTHPVFDNVPGTTLPFNIPLTGHDFSDLTGFEIELKITDSHGLTDTEIFRIYPEKVDVDINTDFPGVLTYTLDGVPRTGDFVLDTAINFQHTLSVPTVVYHNGGQYSFVKWSNNSTNPDLTFTVPDMNTNLTAEYNFDGSPTLINQGLVMRLDAESGVTTTGSTVTGWNDFSGLGNNLTSLGDPQLITDGLNGRDVIEFDGVGDRLQGVVSTLGGLPGGANDRSVFMVARYDSNGYGGFAYGSPTSNRTFGTVVAPNGNLMVQGWGAANDFDSGDDGTGEGWLIQEVVLTANQLRHYRDGVEIDSRTHTFNTNVGAGSVIMLGAEIDGNPTLDMSVAEVLVYNRALNTSERQQVEAYLHAKYFNVNLDPIAVDDVIDVAADDVANGNLLNANPSSWVWNVPVISEDQVNNSMAMPPGDGSTDSPATGWATVEVKRNPDFILGNTSDPDEEYLISVTLNWNGLQGDLTKVHIHGWLTANGDPVGPGNSSPTHMYEIPGLEDETATIASGVNRRSDTLVVTDAFLPHTHPFDNHAGYISPRQIIDEFAAGRAYFNLHTTVHSMGEIRGNFPEITVADFDPNNDSLSVSQVNGNPASVGNQIAIPSGALLTVNANGTFVYDPNGQFDTLPVGQTANDSFTYTISDGLGGIDTATASVNVLGKFVASTGPKLQTGVVTADTTGWTTITLPQSYNDMVVVTTLATTSANMSVATRVRNVTANSFEVMVQRTGTLGGSTPVSVPVHYTVVEAGVYTLAQHGVKMEALKVNSNVTDAKGSYVGQNLTSSLSNSYTNPVVVGQVMSSNDADWSSFWSRGATANVPASATNIWVGKQVGSDPDTTRANEQLGVIVIEQGNGSIGGVSYSAALGAKTVDGVANNGNNYALSLVDPTVAVASISGMIGSDGGWAVLHGANPLTTQIDLAIEEDQEQDFERGHNNEQVAYLVFGASSSSNQDPTANDDGGIGFATTIDSSFTTSSVLANDTDPDSGDTLSVLSINVTGTLGTVTNNNDGTFGYNPSGQFNSLPPGQSTTDTFTYMVSDGNGGSDVGTVTIAISNPAVASGPKLQSGIASVTTGVWTTVTLPQSYSDMVVVTTPVTTKTNASVTTRIRNATGNSFEVMLQHAGTLGGSSSLTLPVHYTVVEAGVYTVANDGVKMEAVKTLSTVTDRKGSYVGQNQTSALGNTYTNPVVIGQVMSFNDPAWSVFWSRGTTEFDPASGAAIWTGKHVGSDPATARANEQIGFIVIEQGSGTIGGFSYSAALGGNSIDGVFNNGNSYPLTISNPTSAIASQSGMHGSDGGWAVLYGAQPIDGQLSLAIEEDQAQDFERSHSNEQVAYILFHELTPPGGLPLMSAAPLASRVVQATELTLPLDGLQLADASGNNTLMITGIEGLIDLADSTIELRGFNRIDLSSEEISTLSLDASVVSRLAAATKSIDVVAGDGDQLVIRDAANWRLVDPVLVDGQFLLTARSILGGDETIRASLANQWRNFLHAGDVDNSGDITAGDALEIVHELNQRRFSNAVTSELVAPQNVIQWPGLYLDRSGDDLVTALDALLVINDLFVQSFAQPEGELQSDILAGTSTFSPLSDTNEAGLLFGSVTTPTMSKLTNDDVGSNDSLLSSILDMSDEGKSSGNEAVPHAVDELLADDGFMDSLV